MKAHRLTQMLTAVLLAAILAGSAQVAVAGQAHEPAASYAARAAAQTQRTHVVQYGETLTSIAARYGITVQQLAAANNITNPNLIYAGQVLIIPDPGGTTAPSATATPSPTSPPASPTSVPATATPAAQAGATIEYVVQRGDTLSGIARRYDTTVEAIQFHNNIDRANTIFAGTRLKIVVGDKTSRLAAQPSPTAQATPQPNAGGGGARWIDINLSSQVLAAYEGDTQVYRSLISSGTSRYPTPTGTFRIYTKLRYDDMRGGSGADYYYLPDVPHVMYFYQGGYAIHGAYWHHNFGTPMSHGCVNLPLDAAAWVYNWAPNGTTVRIHW